LTIVVSILFVNFLYEKQWTAFPPKECWKDAALRFATEFSSRQWNNEIVGIKSKGWYAVDTI
jgi:hypothetical protein